MWLLSYMTKNSLEAPEAAKGNVYDNGTSVAASGEHRSLRACLPYGVASIPPRNECAVVLPLDDGDNADGFQMTIEAKLRRRREHCAEKRRQSADKRQGGLR